MQLWSRGVCVRFATFLKSSVKLSCSAAGSIIVVWREREREKRRNLQENNTENRRTQTEMAGVQTRGNTSFTVAECCRPMRPFYKRVKSQQAGKLCFFPVLFLAVGEKAKHTHTQTHIHAHDHIFTIILQHLFSILFPCLWKNTRISPKWQEHWQNISQKLH